MKKRTSILYLLLVVVILGIGFAAWQFLTLQKAHSSFENYAAFRGCEQITGRTDTSGTCTVRSGKSITIVKINDKWYLEGDGPGVW